MTSQMWKALETSEASLLRNLTQGFRLVLLKAEDKTKVTDNSWRWLKMHQEFLFMFKWQLDIIKKQTSLSQSMIHGTLYLTLTLKQHGLNYTGPTLCRFFFHYYGTARYMSHICWIHVELQINRNWGSRGMTMSYTPLTPAMFKGQL